MERGMRVSLDLIRRPAGVNATRLTPRSVSDARPIVSGQEDCPDTIGANVTAIDASKKNIDIAKYHAKKNKLKIDYICASPETLKIKKKYDVILNMEIVEHVDDVNLFISKSSELLKKNGLMFIATLNKTLKSYIFAIIGAEYILKWLPVGTHDWDKFVKPEDLIKICKINNLRFKKIDGVEFNLLVNQWKLSSDASVNYIAKFKKN